MTASTPTREPERATVGLTWAWRREDLAADYPAPTWTLRYTFRNASTGFTFTATADGTAFAITVAATTTSGYTAGTYSWLAQVESGALKYEIGRGTLIVESGLGSGDPRSHARKVLDAIEAVLEGRASIDQMKFEMSVDGSMRSLDRTPIEDLLLLRDRYRAEVKAEENAARVAQGLRPKGTRILHTFTRTT